jgi:hypothetical protein
MTKQAFSGLFHHPAKNRICNEGRKKPMNKRQLLLLCLVILLVAACSGFRPGGPKPGDMTLVPQTSVGSADTETEVYALSKGQRLFSNEQFRWEKPPAEFNGWHAVRVDLNRTAPLRLRFGSAGMLYAVLWRWDYGFLPAMPDGIRDTLNGWTLVRDNGGRIRQAPEPFASVPLYMRNVGKGEREIDLADYVGQWVIVGFTPSESIQEEVGAPGRITLRGTRTRHNICSHTDQVSVESSPQPVGFDLYRRGVKWGSGNGTILTVPREPGRYALRLHFVGAERTVPLTVGYGRPEKIGWEKGFFPIHFYNGWSYGGLFFPNAKLLGDIQTVAMFELGANTFFVTNRNEIADALGAKSILLVRDKISPIARATANDGVTEARFKAFLDELGPLPATTLGLYVEDEPPLEAAHALSLLEGIVRLRDPDLRLLYTLQGDKSVQMWRIADSSVRMTRSYPITKGRRADIRHGIKEDLADFLLLCQRGGQTSPLWLVAQSFGDQGRPNIWDPPTPAQLRLMVSLALARATKGLTYFVYDSSPGGRENLTALARWPFIPQDDMYSEVGLINARIIAHRDFLSSTQWVADASRPEDDFDIQILKTSQEKYYAWITNWDTEKSVTGILALPQLIEKVSVSLEPAGSLIVDLQNGTRTPF